MADFQITPPPELVQQWRQQSVNDPTEAFSQTLATRAAQWGAAQELEACCADIHSVHGRTVANWLRAIRRPKPPSLKARALQLVDLIGNKKQAANSGDWDTIRRALEALPDGD
jgi:hypothetical protein